MKPIRLWLVVPILMAVIEAHGSVISPHPYGLSSSFGLFVMASSGAFTGAGLSATQSTNFGVSPAFGQIVTMTGTTPQTANSFYATTANNTAFSFAQASVGVIRISSQAENDDAVPA